MVICGKDKRRSRDDHPMRVAVFGNCQAKQIERLLGAHAPFTERHELVVIAPCYEMSTADRAGFIETIKTIDVLLCQHTTEAYAPADSETIRANCRGQILEFPSIWFSGHMPDVTYFHNADGSHIVNWPQYHSRIIASAFVRGLSIFTARDLLFDKRTIPADYVRRNYDDGIAHLRLREGRCDFLVTDFIQPHSRTFHVMNHPDVLVLTHVANGLLDRLGVVRIDYPINDELGTNRLPITGAAARALGMKVDEYDVIFLNERLSTLEMIEKFYAFYDLRPDLIEANRPLLCPEWLDIRPPSIFGWLRQPSKWIAGRA